MLRSLVGSEMCIRDRCRSECVAVAEVARLKSENVASEKKRNSLKLSGDRLHAVT